MNHTTRNDIFMEYEELIRRTVRQNRTLLTKLRLEEDDMYQELAMSALQAIDSYDPKRCASIEVHIRTQLRHTILTLKRRHTPYGMSGMDRDVSCLMYWAPMGEKQLAAANEDVVREQRLRQAIARLEPHEREAVIRYLEGVKPTPKMQKEDFVTTLEKLRGFYRACGPQRMALFL